MATMGVSSSPKSVGSPAVARVAAASAARSTSSGVRGRSSVSPSTSSPNGCSPRRMNTMSATRRLSRAWSRAMSRDSASTRGRSSRGRRRSSASASRISMRWLMSDVSPSAGGAPSSASESYSPVRITRQVRVSDAPRPGHGSRTSLATARTCSTSPGARRSESSGSTASRCAFRAPPSESAPTTADRDVKVSSSPLLTMISKRNDARPMSSRVSAASRSPPRGGSLSTVSRAGLSSVTTGSESGRGSSTMTRLAGPSLRRRAAGASGMVSVTRQPRPSSLGSTTRSPSCAWMPAGRPRPSIRTALPSMPARDAGSRTSTARRPVYAGGVTVATSGDSRSRRLSAAPPGSRGAVSPAHSTAAAGSARSATSAAATSSNGAATPRSVASATSRRHDSPATTDSSSGGTRVTPGSASVTSA